MQAGVFRIAMAIDYTGRDQRRKAHARADGARVLDVTFPVGGDEVEMSLGTGEAVLAQGIYHHRGQGHGALTGFRLEPTDGTEAVRALAHIDLAALQIDIGPAQAAKLRRAQPGK